MVDPRDTVRVEAMLSHRGPMSGMALRETIRLLVCLRRDVSMFRWRCDCRTGACTDCRPCIFHKELIDRKILELCELSGAKKYITRAEDLAKEWTDAYGFRVGEMRNIIEKYFEQLLHSGYGCDFVHETEKAYDDSFTHTSVCMGKDGTYMYEGISPDVLCGLGRRQNGGADVMEVAV